VLISDYTLVERKLYLDIPNVVLEFLNLTPGSSYYVRLSVLDTSNNVTTREEYFSIFDVNPPAINMFTTTSYTPGHITVDVNVTDDSGADVFCSASLN
jgi:hypothetical protein